MMILTKKKQKELLDLVCKSGIVIAEDMNIDMNTYDKLTGNFFDIAFLVDGFRGMKNYSNAIHNALMNVIEECEKEEEHDNRRDERTH